MKRGTKVGWLLIALSVIMSVWVITSQRAKADTTIGEEGEFVLAEDDNTRLIGYKGAGGNITIPSQIKKIDAGVFANKSSVTSVNLNTVETLGTGVFKGCNDLTTVVLGNNLKSIPAETFWECRSLNSVTIPNSVTSIGENAFYQCASMSSITIPASVTDLSKDAFTQCDNLNSINVNNGGPYTSADGCVYNSSGTLLIVPVGKTSVSIAAGTKEIATGAFKDCANLGSLTIPNGVKKIQNDAFSGSGIAVLTVPASVEVFGTQSNWTPTTINGYPGTAAEQYAMNANVLFESMDTGSTDEPSDEPSDNPTGDEPSDNPTQGDVVHPNGSVTHPDGSVTNPDGTTTHPNGSVTNADGTRVKDATPQTADGLDPRYFLCLAVFVGGVGVILYSRFNKLKYMSERRDNR